MAEEHSLTELLINDSASEPGNNDESVVDNEEAQQGTGWTSLLEEEHLASAGPVVHAHQLDTGYESLDYDRCENSLYRKRFLGAGRDGIAKVKQYTKKYNAWRWVMCGAIGVTTALVAFFIDYCIKKITARKYSYLNSLLQDCTDANDTNCVSKSYFYLTGINTAMLLFASLVVVFGAKAAAGSGIPEIKCSLNGVKRADWLTFPTMAAKVLGVLASVSATMPVGKEGPMIHSGAIIGSGLPQGKIRGLFDFGTFMFRNDRAKRDFTAAGAAAGVAAAFGAPIGGVLFCLEEGASFLTQSLIWRTLFCSMLAYVVLTNLQAGVLNEGPCGGWGHTQGSGLVDFGDFDLQNIKESTNSGQQSGSCPVVLWDVRDLPFFLLMGAFGGLMGAVWNFIQKYITILRIKYRTTNARMVGEALLIAIVNTTLLFIGAIYLSECSSYTSRDVNQINKDELRSYFCDDVNQSYNSLATLTLNPLEVAIKQLLHNSSSFGLTSLVAFFFILYFTSCWTYGVMIPSGLFVPSLVCGAAYGRFCGELIQDYIWTSHSTYIGSYALIGAAAFLGGCVRMTISLTVILIEATGEVLYGLPIMLTLITAKFVGDLFNKGIYDIHIDVKEIPYLEWEAEEEMKRYQCRDVMTKQLKCILPVSCAADIYDLLQTTTHNGFPVVQRTMKDVAALSAQGGEVLGSHQVPVGQGRFIGIILRSQLITMLKLRCWGDLIGNTTTQKDLNHADFVQQYPQTTTVQRISMPEDANHLYIDVTPYMNPHPFTLEPNTPLSRVFTLYRTMGLRHLPVLNEEHVVIGLVTRRELTPQKIHELNAVFDHFDDIRRNTLRKYRDG